VIDQHRARRAAIQVITGSLNKWFQGNIQQLFAALPDAENQITTTVALSALPTVPQSTKPSASPLKALSTEIQ
jgi:hypothetical protein